MNLVWIVIILAALAVSVAAFGVAAGIILYFTRRWKWWVRATLVSLPAFVLWFLWNAWLGPHELTGEKDLAERFALVFRFAPGSFATDLHYRLADGPDDMGEWFRFHIDPPALERLSPDLKPVTREEFSRQGYQSPDWWLSESGGTLSYYRGSIPMPAGASPRERNIWIAYDRSKQMVYCYVHSFL